MVWLKRTIADPGWEKSRVLSKAALGGESRTLGCWGGRRPAVGGCSVLNQVKEYRGIASGVTFWACLTTTDDLLSRLQYCVALFETYQFRYSLN